MTPPGEGKVAARAGGLGRERCRWKYHSDPVDRVTHFVYDHGNIYVARTTSSVSVRRFVGVSHAMTNWLDGSYTTALRNALFLPVQVLVLTNVFVHQVARLDR